MPSERLRHISLSIPWNIFLITLGSALFAVGVKGVALHHGFISGGLFGLGMLIYYALDLASPTFWYALFNIPVFILGWFMVSKRFFWYSVYGFVMTSLFTQVISLNLGIRDPLLAAVATGIVCGAGSGTVLRSLGSAGGLDIMAIILYQRYSLRVGQFFFAFNFLVFLAALKIIHIDGVLYSIIIVFLAGMVTDHFMSMFNQRKMVFIISPKYEEISDDILKKLGRGATLLAGRGAFSHEERPVVMAVVQNFQLKRLEELVFSYDENAFMIVENTFNVLGKGFSYRKRY